MRQNIKAYNNDSSSNEFAALLQTDLDKRVTAESSLVNGIVSRIEEKIILIDDVFFTGRTIRAAMNELFDFGRPKEIKLFVLIDREKNELPIKPTFSTDKLIFRSRKSNDQ